jgi:hypothetical protein
MNMDISELGSLGEFFGFFAVIGTLVYLAIQTRQSKQIAVGQAARTIVMDFQKVWEAIGREDEYTRLIRKAVNDWHSISRNEQTRVHSFFINMFIHFNSALEQERILPELIDHIHGWEENIMGFIATPGGKEWYEISNYLLNDPVRERVQNRLLDPKNLPPAWTDSLPWWRIEEDE